MNKIFYYAGLLIIMSISCTTKTQSKNEATADAVLTDPFPKIVDVAGQIGKGRIVSLSEIADSIRYIPLETTKEALIAEVGQVIYGKDHIFILTSNGSYHCFAFDKDGKFQNSICRKGQGSQEFRRVLFSIYETAAQGLVYLDEGTKILVYKPDGTWVNTLPYRSMFSGSLRKSPPADTLVFGSFLFINDSIAVSDAALSSFGRDQYAGALHKIKSDSIHFIKSYQFVGNGLAKHGNTSIVRPVWTQITGLNKIFSTSALTTNDTILMITPDGEISPAYYFDCGKYNGPTHTEALQAWRDRTPLKERISLDFLLESEDYLFLDFEFPRDIAFESFETEIIGIEGNEQGVTRRPIVQRQINSIYALYHKRTNALTLMNQPTKKLLGLKNDLGEGEGPIFWPSAVTGNNELVMTIQAEDFLKWYETAKHPSPETKRIAEKMKEDDNPVVVVVKLKNK